MTIGIYIIIILILGYFSIYLREVWLRLKFIKPLTWLGVFIHESAHAVFCLLTGGRVTGFRVTTAEGYITHYKPKVPVIGPMLTAIAPLLVGLLLMGSLNYFWLKGSLDLTSANIWENFSKVILSLNPLNWQTYVMLAIFLNIGVMVGPSLADLKSIWPLVILSFFVESEALARVLSLMIVLIIINILLFLIILFFKKIMFKEVAVR
jgi:hypothetical protein